MIYSPEAHVRQWKNTWLGVAKECESEDKVAKGVEGFIPLQTTPKKVVEFSCYLT